jgi:ankyrin repeat protein
MFKAVRAGDLPALRIAIARGAHVNGKDELGRTSLQIARERADVETIKLLEAAGAR